MAEVTANVKLKGVDEASPVFKAVARNIVAASKLIQAQNNRFAESFKKIGEQNRWLVRGLKYLSVAAAGLATGAFYKTIQAGSDFGAQIADLSSITGIAGKDLDNLKVKALEFAKGAVVPASEVVEAFKLVASANSDLVSDTNALGEVTKQVLLLSNASGVSLAESAEVATQAMNQFGVGAQDANRFVNVLAAGTKIGAAELGDVGQAIVKVGVAARQAGISFEQTNSAIQVLAQGGLKSAEAGTALRNVFNRLQKQGNKEFNPAIVGLDNALENLGKKNLSTAQLMKLFGEEAASAGAILIRERKRVADWTKEVTATSVANEQAEIRLNTFSKRAQRFGIIIQNSMIKIFEKLLPKLEPLVLKLSMFAESFDADAFAARIGRGIEWIENLVKSFGGLEGIVSKARLAMEAFLVFKGYQTILTLLPAVASLATSTASLSTAAGGAAAGFAGLSGAAITLAAAVGTISFVGTYKALTALTKKSAFAREAVSGVVAATGPIGAGIDLVERVNSYRNKRTLDSMPQADVGGGGASGGTGNSGLYSRISALTQEIAGQQSTLKKPQQIDMRVKVDAPVPTEVTSIKASPGLSVKANTGQMMP